MLFGRWHNLWSEQHWSTSFYCKHRGLPIIDDWLDYPDSSLTSSTGEIYTPLRSCGFTFKSELCFYTESTYTSRSCCRTTFWWNIETYSLNDIKVRSCQCSESTGWDYFGDSKLVSVLFRARLYNIALISRNHFNTTIHVKWRICNKRFIISNSNLHGQLLQIDICTQRLRRNVGNLEHVEFN